MNASLGPQSPDSFDPGVYMQRELSANADLNYAVGDMVNLAGGAEFRDEYFEIGIGETASWEIGPFAAQGFSSGSNGFPGFSDIAAGGWHRTNVAAYGDLEARARDDRWTLGAALRAERFDDFGTTANWKVAARYGLSGALAVRGQRQHRVPRAHAGAAERVQRVHPVRPRSAGAGEQRHHPVDVAGGGDQGGTAAGRRDVDEREPRRGRGRGGRSRCPPTTSAWGSRTGWR